MTVNSSITSDCEFIDKKENILITGSTGIGKSYIASALGHQACSLGYKVLLRAHIKAICPIEDGKGGWNLPERSY